MSEKPFKIKKLLVSFSVRSMAFRLRDERHGIYELQLYTHCTHFPLFSMSFGCRLKTTIWKLDAVFDFSRGEWGWKCKTRSQGQVLHFQFETWNQVFNLSLKAGIINQSNKQIIVKFMRLALHVSK